MTWHTETHTHGDLARHYRQPTRHPSELRARVRSEAAEEQRWPVQSMFGPRLHPVDRVAD